MRWKSRGKPAKKSIFAILSAQQKVNFGRGVRKKFIREKFNKNSTKISLQRDCKGVLPLIVRVKKAYKVLPYGRQFSSEILPRDGLSNQLNPLQLGQFVLVRFGAMPPLRK
jgi:hypothetical protein